MPDVPHNSGYTDSPPVDDVGNSQIRTLIEFFCQMCDHYTYARMNLSVNGNHIMNCPNCDHKHYRVVKDGVITSERFNEKEPHSYEIVAMKSACVPAEKRRTKGLIAKVREMEAAGMST
jgi:hypothetical protein